MTDLELIKRCAEKMGGVVTHDKPRGHKGDGWIRLERRIRVTRKALAMTAPPQSAG